METKNNPGLNSCYRRALPDEPMFVLLGRDRCAPDAIRTWADDRTKRAIEEDWSEDAERITDALDTAIAMEIWRSQHDGSWRNHRPDRDCVPTPTDEISRIAAKILARGALNADAAAAGVPVNGEKFNSLLADAKKLAVCILDTVLEEAPAHG